VDSDDDVIQDDAGVHDAGSALVKSSNEAENDARLAALPHILDGVPPVPALGDGGRDAGGGQQVVGGDSDGAAGGDVTAKESRKKMTLVFKYDDPLWPTRLTASVKQTKFGMLIFNWNVTWTNVLRKIQTEIGHGIVFSWRQHVGQDILKDSSVSKFSFGNLPQVVNSEQTLDNMRQQAPWQRQSFFRHGIDESAVEHGYVLHVRIEADGSATPSPTSPNLHANRRDANGRVAVEDGWWRLSRGGPALGDGGRDAGGGQQVVGGDSDGAAGGARGAHMPAPAVATGVQRVDSGQAEDIAEAPGPTHGDRNAQQQTNEEETAAISGRRIREDTMKLVIHYQSPETVSTQFTVVLKYRLLYQDALQEITKHLPAEAKHYAPIDDFSYTHEDELKFVNLQSTYFAMETFSRQHDNAVNVQLNRLDALQMARRWGTQNHANVFEILKENILQDIVLVDEFPESDVSVYYHLKGKRDSSKLQLNRLEDSKGWFDSEIIDWVLIWWCRENKETMLHSSKDWKKDDPDKNTVTQKTIVLSVYAGTKIVDPQAVRPERQLKGLNLAMIQRIILPVHVAGNHYILIVMEVRDKEYYLAGNKENERFYPFGFRPGGTVSCIDPSRQEFVEKTKARNARHTALEFCRTHLPNVFWEIEDAFYRKQEKQKDDWNCGIFACVNASCISLGRPLPALTTTDFRTVRTWMAYIMYENGQARKLSAHKKHNKHSVALMQGAKANDQSDSRSGSGGAAARHQVAGGGSDAEDKKDVKTDNVSENETSRALMYRVFSSTTGIMSKTINKRDSDPGWKDRLQLLKLIKVRFAANDAQAFPVFEEFAGNDTADLKPGYEFARNVEWALNYANDSHDKVLCGSLSTDEKRTINRLCQHWKQMKEQFRAAYHRAHNESTL